ncbi:MAG: hypothetical protein H7831_10175 [Magnetococcus sp. WYHC-3]
MPSARIRLRAYEAPAGGPTSPYDLSCDDKDEYIGSINSQTGTVLYAQYDSRPVTDEYADAHMHFKVEDVLGIQSFTVATLYIRSISYSIDSSKPPSSTDFTVDIYTGSGWYTFATITSAPSTGTWVSYALDSTAIGHIYAGSQESGYDTELRIHNNSSLANPRYRIWSIAAYENTGGGGTGDWAAYLHLEW